MLLLQLADRWHWHPGPDVAGSDARGDDLGKLPVDRDHAERINGHVITIGTAC